MPTKIVKSSDIYGNEYEVPVDQLVWRPAAYGIVIRDHSILLTRQYQALHLPGGGIKLGEMPEEAVVREVQEETGLRVGNPQLVGQISGFFTQTPIRPLKVVHVHSILLYYLCNFIDGELSTLGFEDDEKLVGELAEWVPLEQLDTIPAGSTIDWRTVVRSVAALHTTNSKSMSA